MASAVTALWRLVRVVRLLSVFIVIFVWLCGHNELLFSFVVIPAEASLSNSANLVAVLNYADHDVTRRGATHEGVRCGADYQRKIEQVRFSAAGGDEGIGRRTPSAQIRLPEPCAACFLSGLSGDADDGSVASADICERDPSQAALSVSSGVPDSYSRPMRGNVLALANGVLFAQEKPSQKTYRGLNETKDNKPNIEVTNSLLDNPGRALAYCLVLVAIIMADLFYASGVIIRGHRTLGWGLACLGIIGLVFVIPLVLAHV
jgi:hypothetical protein